MDNVSVVKSHNKAGRGLGPRNPHFLITRALVLLSLLLSGEGVLEKIRAFLFLVFGNCTHASVKLLVS